MRLQKDLIVSVDTGGTFTDIVVIDKAGNVTSFYPLPQ